jgi:biotin carboxyl carrier protein
VGASRRLTVRHSDAASGVEILPDGRVRVGGTGSVFTVSPASRGEYRVSDGQRSWRVFVAGPADARFVGCGAAQACVDLQPEGQPATVRRTRAAASGTSAPMPGTVIKIAVEVGQDVLEGEILLTLEAMKMELPIRSPRKGTVSAIRCAPGDLVQPGLPLVELA